MPRGGGLAGHHPPLAPPASTGTVEETGRLGTALGLLEDVELHDGHTRLEPGDLLCLSTDGPVEARNGTDPLGPE